jgi:hypothetical protein
MNWKAFAAGFLVILATTALVVYMAFRHGVRAESVNDKGKSGSMQPGEIFRLLLKRS